MSIDISKTTDIAGFIGSCLVDGDTGLMLSSQGGGRLDLEAAAEMSTQVLNAKRQAIRTLRLNDNIEDILITLSKQFHLIRPLRSNPGVFIYLALDRNRANLGMARLQLKDVEGAIDI